MKPSITFSRHVLAVRNLKHSAAYYTSELGFHTLWKDEGWHFLKRDEFCLMLGECPDDRDASELRNHSYFAYAEVDNIDSLFREFSGREVEFLSEPEDKPWGMREFGIRTPDGHRIMFGQEVSDE